MSTTEDQAPEGAIPHVTSDVSIWGDKENPSPTYADRGLGDDQLEADMAEAKKRYGDPPTELSD